MNEIHTTDGKASLMQIPLVCLRIPSELLWEVLVDIVVSLRNRLIRLEPSHESSILVFGMICHSLCIIIIIEIDQLLSLDMDREMIYSGTFLMHREFKNMPAREHRADVTTADIVLDFIDLLLPTPNFHSGEVVAFINIFVNIIYGFY